MSKYFINTQTVFFALLLFWACGTENIEEIAHSSRDSTTIDSSFWADIERLMPKEEKDSMPYPLLLIQECAAILAKECNLENQIPQDSLRKSITKYFKNSPLVSVGNAGVLPQEIVSFFCLNGKCNGNQLAIELSNKECFGLLMNQKTMDELGPFHFVKAISEQEIYATELLSLLQIDSLGKALEKRRKDFSKSARAGAINYKYYLDDSAQVLVQRAYFEHLKEANKEGVLYAGESVISEFKRIFVKSGSHWLALPWSNTMQEWGKWQAELIAYSLKGNAFHQISYTAKGECCPAESQLHLSLGKFVQDSLTIYKNYFYTAGLGQPCN